VLVADPVLVADVRSFAMIPSGCSRNGVVSADGTHTLYAASENVDGTDEPPRSVTVKVDRTPPTLTCAGDPSFRLGGSGGLVTATVKDTGSGAGAAVVTGRASAAKFGKQSAAVTGSDVAGNTATVRCPYIVTAPTLKPSPATRSSFRVAKRYTIIESLSVSSVPGAAIVRVLCKGHGCPFASRSTKRGLAKKCTVHGKHQTCKRVRTKTYGLAITALDHKHLASGATLTIEVSQPQRIGKAYIFKMRSGNEPTHRITCITPGSSEAGMNCS
jgi:hypothetical protein